MPERLPKVNELIRQILAQLISEEIEWPANVLVTVTKVAAANNLKNASVWVSILPDHYGPTALKKLSRAAIPLQQLLNEKINWRFVPKLKFVWDKIETAAAEIDELFEQIKREKNSN